MPIAVRDRPPRTPVRRLGELVRGLSGAEIAGEANVSIAGVQYDSRAIGRGDLFVALVGGYFDGHDFARQAAERGASALLVERSLDIDLPQIAVANTRAALATVAANYCGHPSREIDVIGVTGTDGKTTTTYVIESIFQAAGVKTGVIGTVGVRIGESVLDSDTRQTTPESLDVQRHLRTMVENGLRAAIVEATSHGLDLNRLDETRFATAAVTNVTHEHLEHHKTIAAYRRAKGILFERVGEIGGNAVINLDDAGAREMLGYASGARVLTYSAEGADADLVASEIELGVDGTVFNVRHGDETIRVSMPLVGGFNVANALCALGVSLVNDISLELSTQALATTPSVPGRMQAIRQGQPFAVIVDYAHTPDSIEKVLTLLRDMTAGRLILVMGSAGERDRTKRPLQGAVAARLADFSIFTTEDPRFEDAGAIITEIAQGALDAGAIERQDFLRVTDREEAIDVALSLAKPGDCVVLTGKGHEHSIIWGHEKRPWDEAAVASRLLAGLGYDEGAV